MYTKEKYEPIESNTRKSGKRQDPCVLDVFMSIIDFMNGNEARVWWDYTKERKKILQNQKNSK
ncbi:helix-hairpin-helix domain-containing protein [bacterium]|nr:helix-hairpin-helix domain-containing protein [bacterium]MBU1995130.1 helix-hairpin-helix domain-containing protein [bacterium]